MSYSSQKGYRSEVEVAHRLTMLHKDVGGQKFVRIGNPEKQKKILAGDVVLMPNSDPNNLSFLQRYFLEVKAHAKPEVISIFQKAEDDAGYSGKWGSISYIIRQAKGDKRDVELVVMSPETFFRIAKKLQSLIQSDFDQSLK